MSCGSCENGCGCGNGKKYQDVALLILRLALGIIFVFHGYGKLFGSNPGMTVFTAMVGGMLGFPMAGFFAFAAAFSEFFGGIAMLLGVFTKYASVLIGIVMIVALAGVKAFKLPAGDVDLSLFAITIAVYILGPGEYTIRKLMGKK